MAMEARCYRGGEHRTKNEATDLLQEDGAALCGSVYLCGGLYTLGDFYDMKRIMLTVAYDGTG